LTKPISRVIEDHRPSPSHRHGSTLEFRGDGYDQVVGRQALLGSIIGLVAGLVLMGVSCGPAISNSSTLPKAMSLSRWLCDEWVWFVVLPTMWLDPSVTENTMEGIL
jgi:hypothetical protein